MKKSVKLLIIFLLVHVGVLAQTDTSSLNNLQIDRLNAQDIIAGRASTNVEVVSASRSSKRVKDLPVTIHVITQDEIRKNGYITLVDVMKSVPGVRVSQPGSGIDGETFLFRGQIGNYYTKILINNMPIQPSVSGGIAIGAQLPITQAKQIEVIYGPASAVYGADAMTGVINIITDEPNSRSFANANVTLGEHNYQHFNFMAGGKIGKNNNIVKYTFYGNRGSRSDLNIRHDKEVELIGQLSDRFSFSGNVYSPIPHFFITNAGRSNQTAAYTRILTTNPNQLLDSINFYYPGYQGDIDKSIVRALPQESSLLGTSLEYRGFAIGYHHMFRSNHSSLGRSTNLFSYANSDAQIAERIERLTLSYNQSWKRFSVTLNGSYLKYRMDEKSNLSVNYLSLTGGRSYIYEASDDIFLEALGTYSVNKYMEITAGISTTFSSNLPPINESEQPFNPDDYEPFETNKRTPHGLFGNFGDNPINQGIIGYFTQVFYQRQKLTVIAGFRADASTRFTTTIDTNSVIGAVYPRVALLYKFRDNLSVRASYGRAFKAPSARVTYTSLAFPVFNNIGNIDSVQIQYEQIPNEKLQPEFMTSYETGVRYTINKHMDIDFTAYYNEINQNITQSLVNLSNTEFGANGVSQFQVRPGVFFTRSAVNDENSKAILYGLQLALRLSNLMPQLKLNTDIYLNYADGEEVLPNDRNDKISVHRMVPRFMAQVNFSLEPVKNVYLRFENVYMTDWVRRFVPNARTADFRIDGYYNLDFIGRYQFNRSFGLFLKVKNVFDAEYGGIGATGLDVDLVYNPQLKRNVQFGASFQLN